MQFILHHQTICYIIKKSSLVIENAENKAILVQYRKRMFSKKSKLSYAAACTGTCINTEHSVYRYFREKKI